MKLLRLDLLAFGPFTDTILDLSQGTEGLHLLYGPNEAGKSSALRAVRQLFTGIEHQSNDNFIHKNEKLRIGAQLRNAGGALFEFRRRKGRQKTLLDRNEVAIADTNLDAFLEGLKADDFTSKFTINHSELVAGGRAVISGSGDIGQLLFMAGTSFVGLAAVQKQLDDECDELFKRNASKPRINATCAELEQARRAQRELVLRGSDWIEHDQALRHAREARTRIQGALDSTELALRRLKRFEQALGPIARRKQLLNDLIPLADAVLLPGEFTLDHREAVSKLKPAEIAETSFLQDVKAIDEELRTLEISEVLLEQSETVEHLHLRLGSYQQAMRDRARLLGESAQLEADVDRLRRDLGLAYDSRNITGLIEPLTVDERALIQELSNTRQVVFKAVDDAQSALSRHSACHIDVSNKLEAIGAVPDSASMRKVIAQGQRLGSIEEAIVADRVFLERAQTQADVDLAALGLWSGTLDELERLPVPSAETMEEARARLEAEARRVNDLRTRVAEFEAQGDAINAQIEKLQREGEVPSESDLALARTERETAWDELKRVWSTGPDGIAATKYEQSVAATDELADRLRREASRMADHCGLCAEQARCTRSLDDAHRNLAEAHLLQKAAQDWWCDTWRPLGIRPLSPREMLAWARKQTVLAGLGQTIRERQASLKEREVKVGQMMNELHAEAIKLGAATLTASASLSELIEHSETLVNSLTAAVAEQARLQTDLASLQAERPGLEENLRRTQTERDQWQMRWEVAMQRLSLPSSAGSAQASAVMDRVTELFDRLDKVHSYRRRIETIDHDAVQFAHDVHSLAGRIARHLTTMPAEQAAAELNVRLTRAREAYNRRKALTERREQTEKAASEARVIILAMKARLASLYRVAGCEGEDALPAIEQRSQQRQAIQGELDDLKRQLMLLSGEPFDEFIKEAESKDADVLALEIDRLNDEIGRLKQEQETHDQAIGREAQILKDMNASIGASDANQDAENLRARIRTDVEQYTRLRLASAVLRDGIERYRQKNQGPILNRASELFAALTLGSFHRLAVDYNEKDEPVLKGVRPSGETIAVEGMSLGTADQLYLATKLATLEAYLEKGEPVPFIVDDILIQFDDERATAALHVLAEFSKHTQVLLFTHHRRLVDLAELHLEPGVCFTHLLAGRSGLGNCLPVV